MITASLTTATRPAITSTVGALSDRELLRETRNLVRHERHLQGAVIDHLSEIEARGLYLERGFSSLFDYAVRELGYSDAAAARRIGAMRLCTDQADAREGLRDGSLTLSAAAELQWAFDRQRRRGSISGTAAIAPAETRKAGSPAAESARAVPLPPAEPEPPPLVLDAVGRQKLVEEAAGKSARQVRQMLANLDPELAPPADRVRPLGDGRYELKAVIDAECQQGLEQLRGLLSHVDPRMTLGQLVGRLVKVGLDRHDPSRPPRRARSGSRPADAKANAPPTPTPEQAHGSSAPAPKTGPDAGHRAASTPESQPAVVRRAASTTKDAAIPAGAAPTPARAVRPIATSAPPPSTQEETARRAATRGEADGRRHSGGEVMRLGPRDFGGCQTRGVATRRRALQLRRSTDRAPLQLNASDRDRPHRLACAGRRRSSDSDSDFCVAPITATGTRRAGHRVSLHRDRCLPKGAPRSVSPTRNPVDAM